MAQANATLPQPKTKAEISGECAPTTGTEKTLALFTARKRVIEELIPFPNRLESEKAPAFHPQGRGWPQPPECDSLEHLTDSQGGADGQVQQGPSRAPEKGTEA
jgi:hypothetical protein